MSTDWQDRLLAYDEKNLDPSERAQLERILDTVPGAREFLAQLRADRTLFCEAFGGVQARPEFVTQVMARLPAPRRRPVFVPRLLEALAVGLMAFVVVSIVAPGRDLERRRQLACQTELHDLSRAVASYAEDYDGRLPNNENWVAQVAAHAGSALPVRCPSDDRSDGLSYNMPLGLRGQLLSQLPTTERQVAAYDANGWFLAPRHDRAANVAYFDGSVKLLHEGELQRVSTGR